MAFLILSAWSWLLHLGMGAFGRRCKDHCAKGMVLGSLCGILILGAWSWLLRLGMGALGRRCKDHCAEGMVLGSLCGILIWRGVLAVALGYGCSWEALQRPIIVPREWC